MDLNEFMRKSLNLVDKQDIEREFNEAELKYLVEHEWVRSLDDAIWRRTKQGMWLNGEQQARISEWLAQHAGKSELSLAS